MSTDKMREALVMARAGLVWYRENYPQTFSECDNEAVEQIDAALSQSEPAQLHPPKDWPEDFSHENGNYSCRCSKCNQMFHGHKRRVVCKECAVEPAQVSQDTCGSCVNFTGESCKTAFEGHERYSDSASCDEFEAEPAQVSQDHDEAVILLSAVFDAWENGIICTDGEDGEGSFVGVAFKLDDDIFERCCNLLNRLNPPRNAAPPDYEALKARIRSLEAEINRQDLDFARNIDIGETIDLLRYEIAELKQEGKA